jgi:translocation and assembly module TamB
MAFKSRLRKSAPAAIAVLLVMLALFAAAGWVMYAESPAQLLLPRLAGSAMKFQGIHGRLAGPLHIDKLITEQSNQRFDIDRLQVDWEPLALLRGQLHIRSLQAARIGIVQKIAATTEPLVLPASLVLPLELQIDRLHVDGGELAWGALNLIRLGGFDMQLGFDGQHYRLQLNQFGASGAQASTSASTQLTGQLLLEARQPYALDAQFASTGSTVLEQKRLHTTGQLKLSGALQAFTAELKFALGAAQLEGTALLQPFSPQVLRHADVRAQAIDLSALREDWPRTELSGKLKTDGSGKSELTLLNGLAGALDQHRLPLRDLQLTSSQHADELTIEHLNATVGAQGARAGTIKGSGRYMAGALTLALKVDGLDLRALDGRLNATALDGRIDIRHANGSQDLMLALNEPVSKKNAALEAHVQLSDTRLAIERAELRYAGARLTGKGHVQLDGAQSFAAEGELRGLRVQDLGRFEQLPQLLLNGRFRLHGDRTPELVADLDFNLDNSRLGGQALQGEGQAMLRADRLLVPKLRITSGENQLKIEGELATGASALDFALTAPKLEQFGGGFGGTFNLSGTVNGNFQKPHLSARWDGRRISAPGTLSIDSTQGTTDLTLDQRQAQLLSGITLDAELTGMRSAQQQLAKLNARLQFSPLAAAPLALDVRAEGWSTPQIRLDKLVATASGTTTRHMLQITLQETGSAQQWTTELNGGLQQRDRLPFWQGEISRFDIRGRLNAQLVAPAPFSVGVQRLQLDGFTLDAQGSSLQIAHFLREGRTITSQGRLQQLQVAQILALSGASPSLTTDLLLDGEWDVKLADKLSGQLALRRHSGDIILRSGTPIALGLNTLEASASLQAGGIALRLNAEGQRLGRIAVNATANATSRATLGTDTTVTGNASIDIPSLAWLGPLLSPGMISDGRLKSDITLAGSFAKPQFSGRIIGTGLRLYLADSGIDLRQGALDSQFQGESLIINSLDFRSEAGLLAASGEIGLAAAKPTAKIKLRAERFALFNRSDRKLVLSGQADLDWASAHGRIKGALRADSGYFDIGGEDTPQLSDDVVVVGSTPKSAAPTATEIDMDLNLGDGVRVQGRGLSAILVGEVKLRSAPGSPLRAQGSVRVADGTNSTYTAYSRKLAIEQGVLRFNGPLNNPALDIIAMRRGEEVEAGVAVRGTVLAPRITLVSEPTVPDAEKLAWLVLGHGLDNAGNADMGALQTAAGALLTGGAAAGVQKQLATAFGFDDVRIGSTTQDNLQQRIITLGKRVSSRLYLSYQQSLQSTGSVLLLRYTLSPRLTIEAEAGTRSALSLLYNVAFD